MSKKGKNMELEKMGDFFDRRLEGYETHQLTCIASAEEFYPYTASLLPAGKDCTVLDLGCGTGLELNEYFKRNPSAKVTGIDLAGGMLQALKAKFPDKRLTLIKGSYFDIPFGTKKYDAAVSVESLHHFTRKQKIPLYRRLHDSLKTGGYFVLTDYMAENEEAEARNFAELSRIKKEQGISDGAFYHFDTPLTEGHEKDALLAGGFQEVEHLMKRQSTVVLRAYR